MLVHLVKQLPIQHTCMGKLETTPYLQVYNLKFPIANMTVETCQAGHLGSHLATTEEVRQVRHDIKGRQDRPQRQDRQEKYD